jgi:AcrR family transcriptional regulator
MRVLSTQPPRRRYAPRLPPEERREQVLDATLDLIVEEGVTGTSMEAVARRAGVTKPVVYGVFGDRGELLHALLEREEQRALAQLAEIIPSGFAPGQNPDAALGEAIIGFLRAVAAEPRRWRMILLPVDSTPPIVREHIEAGRRVIAGQLQLVVSWGLQARGGATADLDAELLALSLMALAENAATLVLRDPERYAPERLSAFTQQAIGLLPRA